MKGLTEFIISEKLKITKNINKYNPELELGLDKNTLRIIYNLIYHMHDSNSDTNRLRQLYDTFVKHNTLSIPHLKENLKLYLENHPNVDCEIDIDNTSKMIELLKTISYKDLEKYKDA